MFRPSSLATILCASTILSTYAHADDLLRLWGIDADDAQLFVIDDVNNPQATFSDLGPIYTDGGVSAEPITGEIRAFTVVNTFDAYAVVNGDVGASKGPVLIHMDLEKLEVGIPVVAEVIGSIGEAGWDDDWTITGIAGDPLYNVMYVLSADGDPSTNDRLTRVHADTKRRIHAEPIGEITWQRGGVRMGSDISLGPAGLLLVADEARGRIVMVEPETGTVRGVRLEGVRVDTDTARYAGIAWDGYNDRTAMFDRNTGMLVVDDRTHNSISAFELTSAGVTNAEGLEFVFRPTPPGEGGGAASSSMRHVSNIPRNQRYGSRAAIRPNASGGGGGSNPIDLADLLGDPADDTADDPVDDAIDDLPDDPFDDPTGDDPADDPVNDPPGDDPDDPTDNPVVPTPGAVTVLGLGVIAGSRRRRRATRGRGDAIRP